MRPVKDSTDTIEKNTHPRSSALRHFGAEGHKETLDVDPPDVASYRVIEDSLKGFSVFASQTHSVNI